jgi:HPt (histidine-containing phosphotransfer) domain-containing protein
MENKHNDNLVNLTSLRGLLGDNNESIVEVLNLFIANIPPSILEIRALMEKKDWDGLRKKVHSIKSYYGYVGNDTLNQKLNDWEVGLANNPLTMDNQGLMEELEIKSRATVEQINQILNDEFGVTRG